MNLFGLIQERLRQKKVVEVLKEVVSPEEINWAPSRADRRHYRNQMKKRGPGWTRPYRKGRTQRQTTKGEG